MTNKFDEMRRVPTDAMREAAASFGGKLGYSKQRGDEAVETWADMLAAAPQVDAIAAMKGGE